MTNNEPSRIDHDTQAYWEGLQARKLALAHCGDCQHWIHPPKACCPVCWSDNIGHEQPSGDATLFSYLVQPIAPGAPPSVVGWVELVEQPRLIVVAQILGVTAETVRIGARLHLEWVGDGPHFQPVFRQEATS
ncbi:MAG: Zn-ribbon domain-containing OB-fold protein [Caulobacter sp.]